MTLGGYFLLSAGKEEELTTFKKIVSLLTILFMVFPAYLYSGTTGKIAGTVKDAATGEPLPGCNVIITGTTMGAASDIHGEYFIINVPPGRYNICAQMMGYKTVNVTDAQVMVDLTTQANFSLQTIVLELGEEVTVLAERPLVQKDVTSKQAIVGSEEIVNMPVESFQDVLTTKAGFTKDADGAIHVRGGRSGEIAYMIDGMYVEDPLYGGFSSMFNEDAIDEMVVLSGTFNAEYGDAMSSIVNIVTKEGRDTYHGKLEYTSAMLNQSPYRQKNPFPNVEDSYEYAEHSIIDDLDFKPLKLELPLSGTLNSSFSGPLPFVPKLYFFVSGRYKNEDSYLPHGYSLQRDGFAKLTYRFKPTLKLSVTGQQTKNEYQPYNHAWKYRSDHQNHNTQHTNRLGLTWTHTLSPNLFYTVIFSRYNYHLLSQVGDKQPHEYERGQTGAAVDFYVKGDDENYTDDQTTTFSGKADITYQANTHHQFKGGAEFKSHKIDVHEEQEPWPAGAQFKEKYTKQPVEFAAYIQDKIEYDYLILNIGLRYDYADPKASMWPNIFRFGYWDDGNNWIPTLEEEVKPKTQPSPRVGLAHPITDRAVLHFSYGQFFQNPDYNALYYNLYKDLSTSMPLVGNPKVKAQKTVAYETGIKFQLSDHWVFDLTAWYKDITDLLSTYHISYLSQDYVVFYNSDYASVKGIDVTLTKRYSNYVSGSIDYTYMVAKGNNSQPLGGYIDAFSQEEIPHQEFYLDFDQRHDVAVNLNFTIPKDAGPEIFGLKPLSDLNMNVLFQAGSGLPYTPYVDPTVRIEINSGRKPWTSTLDLRMIKKISVLGLRPALFVEITNLFDRENVVHVYSRTGKPFDTGLADLVGSSPDANHNPLHVGAPRIIKAGVQVLW